MVGAGVLYCREWRKAKSTARLPSRATYSFAVTSLVRGESRRYRSPVCTVGRMRLYRVIIFAASAESSGDQRFRFAPMLKAPCIASRKRNCNGVLRPFMLGTSVTHEDISFGA